MTTPKGIVNAILTPFAENGKIDFHLLEKQTSFLIDGGLNGLFVNGSTGEGLLLTAEERYEILSCIKEVSNNRVDLYACCIQPTTHQVVKDIEKIQSLDPDYVVAVPPLYYSGDQDMLYIHFKEIASASSAPLVLYNFPQMTNNPLRLETLIRLAEVENIIGVKDSSGDFLSFVQGAESHATDKFCWMQGDDLLHTSSLQAGSEAVVTGLGNVSIKNHVGLYNAFLRRDYDTMWAHQKELNKLYRIITVTGKGIPAIKAATAILGRSTFPMKDPWLNLTKAEIGKVESILTEIGINQ
ncbi:dihydrodipicolinate synthase family protein [Fulvivirgaceae bacterium BMA12]|uniref:Dihydrodipicolinate synthase family protein n=1 Tax=Agaribacillus aureus TaxID=3051825 RepID=A0ABT8L202_9BACT|nr:dihydrodipicolinate synthase family protein [Fulvivirgaceae bacterium BMA12]